MASRKRGSNESFKAYRQNLKREDKKLKARLKGVRVLWPGHWGQAIRQREELTGRDFLTNGTKVVYL